MAKAKAGDTVRVHYTGTFEDGEVFDSSRDSEPLEFILGAGDVIAGFDDAVKGMSPGDQKTVTIAARDAYGEHREELLMTVALSQLPAHLDPELGEQLELKSPEGEVLATIVEINDDHIVLDANHPLAGQDLTFALELVEIA